MDPVRVTKICRTVLLRLRGRESQFIEAKINEVAEKMEILERGLKWAIGDGDKDRESEIQAKIENLNESFEKFRYKSQIIIETYDNIIQVLTRRILKK